MEYVCLAAGKGTRFGALGRYLQKCMYPVGLTPFVELSVRNLRRSVGSPGSGDRLTFVVGHLGEQLRAYFGSAYDGLPVRYLEQGDVRGTGHALRRVQHELRPSGATIVWLADLYVPVGTFRALSRHEAGDVLTLAPAGDDANASVRVTTAGSRVVRAWFGAGPLADIGLWKLEPEVLGAMTDATGDEVRALPNLQRLIDGGRSVAFIETDAWIHLGGTEPTPSANVRRVVERLWDLEGGGA